MRESIALGREAMAGALNEANPAHPASRRAAKEKAQQACAPIVAAMKAEMVRPAFKHLVSQTEK